ncbi:cytomegalovirus gH-receptor family protein, partial [Aspergillus arachidicola]
MVSPLLSPLAPKQDEFLQTLVASDDDRKSRNFPTSRLEGSAVARMMDGLHNGSDKQQDTDIFAGSSLSESVSPSPGQRQTEAIAEARNQEKMPRRSRQLQPSPLNLLDDGSEAPDDTKRRSLGAEPHRNGSQVNGHSTSHRRSPSQRTTNGDQKDIQYSLTPDQAFGMVFEHSQGPGGVNGSTSHRTSLVDVIDGPEVATVLNQWSGEVSPVRNQDTDRERVPKLSPAKIQELTSSPQSIPYRAADSEHGRRVISDQTHASNSQTTSTDEASPLLNDIKFPPDHATKSRTNKEFTLDGGLARPPTSSTRHRSQSSRAVSTPTSARRQTLPSNERLAQTWASRSKHDRPSIGRESESKHLHPAPEMADSALPSPIPPSIPLPPLSIPTYLQLELASGRPSPLYIHPSAASDFPYESSRVKLERLVNFFMLPPVLEQVFWFGILACLDSWLYSFTILPLRFVKALYILLESWMINLGVEFRFISGFIIKGVGRVWRRRNKMSGDGTDEQRLVSEAEGRLRQESAGTERDVKTKAAEARRRCRSDAHHKYQHHRQKSIPSTLLPDDKADILKGLLMIATCAVLMYFDASRMYHWIRGQAAIKLYVIYNVLEVSDRLFAAVGQDVLECLFSREALERRPNGRSKVFRPFGLFLLALAYTVVHATALFYQVMTLNVAVNSYSNALLSLLLSNQCGGALSALAYAHHHASRNIVETGAFNFIGNLGSSFTRQSTSTNSTPLSTPPRTMSSILPQSFTIVPSSIIASFSHVNSFLPTLAQVLGPFLVVLGSEMLVDWLKHAYIGKFNNTRPAIYKRFLDILTKDYYTNAFGDQNLTHVSDVPGRFAAATPLVYGRGVDIVIFNLQPLCPRPNPVTAAVDAADDRASICGPYERFFPAAPSEYHAIPSALLLGMVLLAYARSRYRAMKQRETEQSSHENSGPPRAREYAVEGSRRFGGWGVVEVNDDHRRWIYTDDPEGLRRLKAKEEKEKNSKEELNMDHVRRLWRRLEKVLACTGSVSLDDEVYLLNRSPKESARLNAQHNFLVDLIGGKPIHPAIPIENITAIADVATGTGIWLSSLITAPKVHPTNRLYLHGFDISSAQYPFSKDIAPTHELHLSTHDMRNRFPPKHRGRYDLVHLRLLVGALKEEDYLQSMRNIFELLKPGGYLQWDDCDTTAFSTAESSPDPFILRMQETVASAAVNLGLCPTAPVLIEKLAKLVGFEDVSRQSYNTIDKPYLHNSARAWLVQVLRSLLPKSMLGTGEVTEEKDAVDRTERLVEELETRSPIHPNKATSDQPTMECPKTFSSSFFNAVLTPTTSSPRLPQTSPEPDYPNPTYNLTHRIPPIHPFTPPKTLPPIHTSDKHTITDRIKFASSLLSHPHYNPPLQTRLRLQEYKTRCNHLLSLNHPPTQTGLQAYKAWLQKRTTSMQPDPESKALYIKIHQIETDLKTKFLITEPLSTIPATAVLDLNLSFSETDLQAFSNETLALHLQVLLHRYKNFIPPSTKKEMDFFN